MEASEKKYTELDRRGTEDDTLVIRCACGDYSSELVVSYYADDLSEGTELYPGTDPNNLRFKGMQFGVRLCSYGFWDRLINGLKYIFRGSECRLQWVDITTPDTFKIEKLFERYRAIPLNEENDG